MPQTRKKSSNSAGKRIILTFVENTAASKMHSNQNKVDFYKNAKQSEFYAKYRLSAPKIIIDQIINYLSEKLPGPHEYALDVGCGTGLSTRILSPYFQKVTGTDVSETQLFEARRHPDSPDNVQYKIAAAESLPFEENSLQLITASSSLHWFDLETFIDAAKIMLQDNGVLAIYSGGVPTIKGANEEQTEKIKSILQKTNENFSKYILGSFERDVWKSYARLGYMHDFDMSLLKDAVRYDHFTIEKEITIATIIGFIPSNPGYRQYAEAEGDDKARELLKQLKTDILEELGLDLNKSNENDDVKIPVTIKPVLIMGRK